MLLQLTQIRVPEHNGPCLLEVAGCPLAASPGSVQCDV